MNINSKGNLTSPCHPFKNIAGEDLLEVSSSTHAMQMFSYLYKIFLRLQGSARWINVIDGVLHQSLSGSRTYSTAMNAPRFGKPPIIMDGNVSLLQECVIYPLLVLGRMN